MLLVEEGVTEARISTMNVPPVEGCRATSPRPVEKVERSSWAYWLIGGPS